MSKVLISTPTYDGKLSAWYVNSLLESIKLCANNNILLHPIWMSYDALIERARNDLAAIAIKNNFDSVIWIDADISWDPEWILKLIQSEKDVIGGTYRKKTDEAELYTVKTNNLKKENNILEVEGLGFGFIKISRKALLALWEKSIEYNCNGKIARHIFEVKVENNQLISEDIVFCNKLRELGFKIYLDINMTCNHEGPKIFSGNFSNFLDRINDGNI